MEKIYIPLHKGGWVGFDLDGTLAKAPNDGSLHSIGPPIPSMISLVKEYLDEGVEVRIVTARAAPPFYAPDGTLSTQEIIVEEIEGWCQEHIGTRLKVTASKDFQMKCLYDDRAIQVKFNEGVIVG